jgi:hypothetical protein
VAACVAVAANADVPLTACVAANADVPLAACVAANADVPALVGIPASCGGLSLCIFYNLYLIIYVSFLLICLVSRFTFLFSFNIINSDFVCLCK